MLLLDASPSPAAALLRTALGLAFVLALAVLVLRLLAKAGVGRGPTGRRLEVVERLPLDGQSAVVIVRVDGRELVLGTSAGAAPSVLERPAPRSGESPSPEV